MDTTPPVPEKFSDLIRLAIAGPLLGTIVSDFESWEEFDSHLAGLEVVANIFEELGY